MKRSLTAKTEDNGQHLQKKPARKVVAEVYVLQDGVDTGSIVGRDTRDEYAVILVFCDSDGVVAIRRGGLDGGDEVLVEEGLACGDRVIKDRGYITRLTDVLVTIRREGTIIEEGAIFMDYHMEVSSPPRVVSSENYQSASAKESSK